MSDAIFLFSWAVFLTLLTDPREPWIGPTLTLLGAGYFLMENAGLMP